MASRANGNSDVHLAAVYVRPKKSLSKRAFKHNLLPAFCHYDFLAFVTFATQEISIKIGKSE